MSRQDCLLLKLIAVGLDEVQSGELEMRVTPQQDAAIRQAAHLENTTVTAFVLDAVTAQAHK